jgi:hypothetical protein
MKKGGNDGFVLVAATKAKADSTGEFLCDHRSKQYNSIMFSRRISLDEPTAP